MIYTAAHVKRDLVLAADVCVVGSGAGGAPVAAELAARGKRVIVLEAGSHLLPRDFTQIEYDMFQRLYHDKAGRTTRDRAIRVHQGKGVGGSTLHNLNLCARIPEAVFAAWRERYGLTALPPERLHALYADVEARLLVTEIESSAMNGNNLLLKRGCEVLGYRGGMLRHNRAGCASSGFCELGCPFDAKQNAAKVYLPAAVEAGATILADTWATALRWEGRKVRAVEAAVRDPQTGRVLHRVTVEAAAVCVSASATGTPALLRRSEVPDPHRLVGSRLFLHPGSAVAAVARVALRSWIGIPQSYECTELLDFSPKSERRVWIVPAFAHPAGVSAILAGFGAEHARVLGRYPRLAALSAMVHDEDPGRVGPRGAFGVEIDYELSARDAAQLVLGLRESARLLLAAGVERVIVPKTRPLEIERLADVDRAFAGFAFEKHDLEVTAVHPQGSVWMGDDPAQSCVDSTGRYHHLDNLWVADTSLFPSSIGVPPQLSTYALGTHVGQAIASSL